MCRSGRQQKKNIIWINASEAAVCLKRDLSSLMRKIEKGTFKGKANEAPPSIPKVIPIIRRREHGQTESLYYKFR